jgi:hypothetical protein
MPCFEKRTPSTTLLVAVLVFCAAASLQAQHEHAGPAPVNNKTFNSIKALAGDWQGSFEWIGTTRKGAMNARYYVTGNGSAVVEDLIVEGSPNMTTVYHLDGTDLRATHYCAAGNQPRLKATSSDENNNSVKFQMIDITNLSRQEAGHVRDLELRFNGANQLTIRFTFVGAGKESVEKIELTRKT